LSIAASPSERFVVTTTVLDRAAGAVLHSSSDAGCLPATCRIGLLGLGNVGSAFARLTRDGADALASRGFTPVIATSLVRNASRARPADLSTPMTDDSEAFFAEPVDVIVEALGGVEPAFTLVRRALDRGIPVVTANKSLIAAHGDALARLARRRGTALRYEAACIAGVPFLGTFERRALVARASGVTAILNGTSNYILTAMTRGGSFASALAGAQQLGYAEPDPSMDISGADAAEKLTILIRLFGRLLVDPRAIPLDGLGSVEADDIAAAVAFGGALRPVSRASWSGAAVRAHVGPSFVDGTHPLARVAGVTNGVVIDAAGGVQCYIGPGAGPDVTAATLLDDVSEIVTERRVRTPPSDAVHAADSISRPESAWFIRFTGTARPSDIADLLGSYGIWCTRLERRADRAYAVTCHASVARLNAALDAVQAATGATTAAFPALSEEAHS
jgi:homoserine dehydrogenase